MLLSVRMTHAATSTKLGGRRSGRASAGVQLGAARSSTAVSSEGRPAMDVSCGGVQCVRVEAQGWKLCCITKRSETRGWKFVCVCAC